MANRIIAFMPSLILVMLALIYLPWRLSRGFSAPARVLMVMVGLIKAIILIAIHVDLVDKTGIPIILDVSRDAKMYYDFGVAFINHRLVDISLTDIEAERNATAHLGYYIMNMVMFKVCPEYPMLFLRLLKLALFQSSIAMLASTWRVLYTPRRAFIGYCILGIVLYQFTYYHFRNLKDDVILSLFIIIMSIADGTIFNTDRKVGFTRRIWCWIAIVFLVWLMSTFRSYMALAIVTSFAMHTVTGRGMKVGYRIVFIAAIFGGFLAFTATSGYRLMQETGGAEVVIEGADNYYGLFKVLVSPLPWQHLQPLLAVPHTFYLFMLGPALWKLISDFHNNLNWKFYVVIQLMLVVGGVMKDFEPRKRYAMYPIFLSWILAPPKRKEETAFAPQEPFNPDEYFARPGNVYA